MTDRAMPASVTSWPSLPRCSHETAWAYVVWTPLLQSCDRGSPTTPREITSTTVESTPHEV